MFQYLEIHQETFNSFPSLCPLHLSPAQKKWSVWRKLLRHLKSFASFSWTEQIDLAVLYKQIRTILSSLSTFFHLFLMLDDFYLTDHNHQLKFGCQEVKYIRKISVKVHDPFWWIHMLTGLEHPAHLLKWNCLTG